MTRKTRYFFMGSAGALLLGIGAGLFAYRTYHHPAAGARGLPAELRFVPADAELVAYADVHSIMASDMRKELERVAIGQRGGQPQTHEFAGIDVEKNINHVVVYAPVVSGDAAGSRALMLAQGTFDQAKVEQFIQDHGGSVEDYHGKRLLVRKAQPDPTPHPDPAKHEDMAVGFVHPDLIAVGTAEFVKHAMDASTPGGGGTGADVTTNPELARLMRDASSGTAWVVGRFDAVSRGINLPPSVRQQIPPLRLVSVSAHIDGGLRATIKAETADKAAADQLRDVVRGAISFVRLQAGTKPELQDTFKSIEISGTGTRVELSFTLTPDAFRAITPQHPQSSDQPQPPATHPKP
jgi:hypothetical protein